MTNTTNKPSSKERRALERRVARLAKALNQLRSDAGGIVAEASEMGLRDEQVGAVMIAMDALHRACSRASDASRTLDDKRVLTYDDEPATRAEVAPLATAKFVPGQGYVLNGRLVG